MSDQNFSLESFTPEETEKIKQAKDTAHNVVKPKLIQLSADDRKSMPKTGHKLGPFCSKTYDLGTKNPQFVPPFINMEEFRKNLEIMTTLTEYLEIIDSIREMVADTILSANSKAYQDSLSIYDFVKAAAKNSQPGAQLMADELGKWFQRGPSEPPAGPAKA